MIEERKAENDNLHLMMVEYGFSRFEGGQVV